MTPPSRAEGPRSEESTFASAISLLLIVGVSLSAAVIVFGLALLLITGQTGYHEALSPALVLSPAGTVDFPRTVSAVVEGALALKPAAVILLGALLLIATPVLRVAASVGLFLAEGDYLYTAITAAVLALLLFSLFGLGGSP